jgi:hypothetical protein
MSTRFSVFIGLCVLCAPIFPNPYSTVSHAAQSGKDIWELTDRLSAPENGEALRRHLLVKRKGRVEDATVLVAPVSVRVDLAGFSGRFIFKMLATPVFNVGDGMQMDLLVATAGNPRQVFTRYFDAGRKSADRDWIPVEIPLALAGTDKAFLEIRISGGPQGDLVADWLAVAKVQMERERASR